MVYLFCSDLLLFSRKFAKIVQDADLYKNGGHKCHKYEHKNFARENCKSKVAFLQFVYLCAKYWQNTYAETQDSWSKGLITCAGLVSVCRDLGTFVKRNKTQLRDYMTTGPARLAEIPVSRC